MRKFGDVVENRWKTGVLLVFDKNDEERIVLSFLLDQFVSLTISLEVAIDALKPVGRNRIRKIQGNAYDNRFVACVITGIQTLEQLGVVTVLHCPEYKIVSTNLE